MEEKQNVFLERTYAVWGTVLLLWSLYRFYARLPEWFDDLIAKPLVFMAPVFLYVHFSEKRILASLGLMWGKFYRDVYLGLGFGMLFALEGIVTNAVKYGMFSFAPVIAVSGSNLLLYVVLSLVSGFTEELLVRGFLYTRLKENYKSELKAMVVSTVMYFILLVPFIFTVSKLNGVTLLIFVVTNLILSFANTMIFNETKTLTVPVLIHAFWNMAVALYL